MRAICEIPLPEVLWSSSGSGPRHCSHTNKMSSKHFGSIVQKEPIPSQEYHPLRWEWVIRFPYPHLPLSLSALGIEANKGLHLWVRPPPPSRGCQRCSVRTGCHPAPLPTPAGQPFSDRSPCLQQAALCVAPLPSSGSLLAPLRQPGCTDPPARAGLSAAGADQAPGSSRPETSPLLSAGSASSGPASVPRSLPGWETRDRREKVLSRPRTGSGGGEGGDRGESRVVGGSVSGRQRMADAGSRRVGRLKNR